MLAPTLVMRLKDRDPEAFSELCGQHRERLYRIAWSVSRNPQDAHDILQDTLTSAWRSLDTLRDDTALGAWLGRIALNHGRMLLRSRRRRPAEPLADIESAFLPDGHRIGELGPWPSLAADDALTRARAARRLHELAEALPDDLREVWTLADVEHLSMADISELTSLTVPNVKTRLHRARLALRDALAREYEGTPR